MISSVTYPDGKAVQYTTPTNTYSFRMTGITNCDGSQLNLTYNDASAANTNAKVTTAKLYGTDGELVQDIDQ